MRIDWRTDKNAPYCRCYNLDTGECLSPCAMADEENGVAERYVVEPLPDGRHKWLIDPKTKRVKTEMVYGRISIVPVEVPCSTSAS